MKLKPLVLHVGYPKAGSTWLQSYLQSHPSVWSFGHGDPTRLILQHNELAWDGEAVNGQFNAFRAQMPDGLTPVFTRERLIGNPQSGHYDLVANLRRLAVLFPDARVMIVVREQYDEISSIYRQYIKAGGTRTLDDWCARPWRGRSPQFDFAPYAYDRVVKLYRDAFPAGVDVFFYEDLRANSKTYIAAVCEYLGVPVHIPNADDPVNVGVRQEDVEARRAMNWMRPTETSFSEPHLFDLGLGEAEVGEMAQQFAAARRDAPEYKTSFREYLKRQYGGRYRESNRELAELCGRDVAALGYEV